MVYKKKTINKVTTVTRDKNGQNETIYLSAFTWHTRKLACKMQPTFNIMTDLSTSKKKKKHDICIIDLGCHCRPKRKTKHTHALPKLLS